MPLLVLRLCSFLLLILQLRHLVRQSLNVGKRIEVVANEVWLEALVEDEAVVVLIEAILVDAHEAEKLRVDHLLSLQDAHFVWEHLLKIH